MSKTTATPQRGLWVILLLAITVVTSSAILSLPPSTARAEPVAITEAPPLTWGFKHSWRVYVGHPEASNGAAVVGDTYPGNLAWEFDSGTYDEETGTTILSYKGTVHWLKYPLVDMPSFAPSGYTGPWDVYILDVTLSDPVITISREAATVTVDAQSRQRSTMAILDVGRVVVANLDIREVTPEIASGVTTWQNIPAAVGPAASSVFAGGYTEGIAIDPVSFSYSGPGGAPDFSEDWTEPGTTGLALVENVILHNHPSSHNDFSPYWVDRTNRVVHYRHHNGQAGANRIWSYLALDLDTMEIMGEPMQLAASDPRLPSNPHNPQFQDYDSQRLFYGSATETRWMRFDSDLGQYVFGVLEEPIPYPGTSAAIRRAAWDSIGKRAVNISQADGVWRLHTYTENETGAWELKSYVLPAQSGYPTSTPLNEPTIVAAPDGSLIVLRTSGTPRALRVWLNEEEATATVEPIEGTETADAIRIGPDNTLISLVGVFGTEPNAQNIVFNPDGTTTVGPRVVAPWSDTPYIIDIAVDTDDGTMWFGSWQGQRLLGIKDGVVVTDQYFPERHPRGGLTMVGLNNVVYAQTNDGSPAGFGGSPIFGLGKFERVGVSPTVTEHPQPVTVSLPTGDATETVAFSAAGTGEPEPSMRWQVKTPGSQAFADIEGETGPTLTVDATPNLDGAEYRAVFSNAAGSIASDVAVLTVEAPPAVLMQPVDVTIVQGQSAQFMVMPTGSPYPEITWQLLLDHVWTNITPETPGHEAEGGFLTVVTPGLGESGTQYRAELSNSIGTIHTEVVTLTVGEGEYLGTGSWGIRESYRTYVVGPIAEGEIEVSDGAGDNPPFTWPVTSASYDPETGTGVVQFAGSVYTTGHHGILENRWSNPRLVIDGDTGTLYADLEFRPFEGVNPDPIPDLQTQANVAFGTVDLSGVNWTTDGSGFITITGAPVVGVTAAMELIGWSEFYASEMPNPVLDALSVTFKVGGSGPGEPGDGTSQTVRVNVLTEGALSISVAGTQVALPPPVLNGAGDALVSSGELNEVTVVDLRSSNPGWSLNGQASAFTSGDNSFGGERLGWTPELVSQSESQNVSAGEPVAPGGSLGVGATLAAAASGGGRGTAVFGAELELSIPTTTPAGVYSSTLTITVI